VDVHTKEQRSRNMAAIHNKDSKPELLLRSYLFQQGFRYRKNVQSLPGKPDIVLPKYRTVIFVNGCFWHGHNGCRYFQWPETNQAFWERKISDNIARDAKSRTLLNEDGWNVIVVWECELRKDVRNQTFTRVNEILTTQLLQESHKEDCPNQSSASK